MADRNNQEQQVVIDLSSLQSNGQATNIADINQVVQGLLPELQARLQQQRGSGGVHYVTPQDTNSAVAVTGDHAAIPYSHPHSHGSQGDTAAVASSGAQSNNTFVINLGQGAQPAAAGGRSAGGRPQSANRPHSHGAPGDAGAALNQLGMRMVIKWVQTALPFLILLLAKVLYDHRLGILVFGGLLGTFYHANNCLKKHVSRQTNKYLEDEPRPSVLNAFWIALFMSSNIAFIYYVFEEQKLYKSLYFFRPDIGLMDVWNLCWVVGVTDFIVKFSVVIIKSVISMLPACLVSHKNKGAYYMLLEQASQLYRCVLPIMPWFYFLCEEESGAVSPRWFSYILVILYFVLKAQHIFTKSRELRRAFKKFCSESGRGITPSFDELKESENTCPICHDKFSDPVKLSCKHIFCEDCVSLWFDREHTCPMCRTVIVDQPVWRDGATSSGVQIY